MKLSIIVLWTENNYKSIAYQSLISKFSLKIKKNGKNLWTCSEPHKQNKDGKGAQKIAKVAHIS